MDWIEESVDKRQKSWCIHCRKLLFGLKTNRDHVPTKTLLLEPYPENLPVVTICVDCNTRFSKDEQYVVAFLGAVMSGSTEPESQSNPSARRTLQYSQKLRSRIERSKREYKTDGGDVRLYWEPEQDRIDRVILKNARGHAFFEFGEPMMEAPAHIGVWPLVSLLPEERESFENIPFNGLWPEVGSRMMTRVMTGQDLDGSWVVVQAGVYRYGVAQIGGGLVVRSVISEYLATEVIWGG